MVFFYYNTTNGLSTVEQLCKSGLILSALSGDD